MRALLVQRVRQAAVAARRGGGRRGRQRAHGLQMAGPASARGAAGARGSRRRGRIGSRDGPRRRRRRAIVAARHERLTAWAIAARLQVPRSTVAAILVARRPQSIGASRAASRPSRAMSARGPASWSTSISSRSCASCASGTASMATGARACGAGWEYVHVAVDDYSRAAYVEVLPEQTGATTAGFLRRTIRWLARRGVVVERVLTDNGSAYISRRFQRAAAARRRAPDAHAALSPANQRQGRALHPNADSRLGLCRVRIPARGVAPAPCGPGSGTTTSSGLTPRSAINHRASAFRGSRSDQPC